MVISSAFAIIVPSSFCIHVFPSAFCAFGSGRWGGQKGGPREARRLFGWRKPVSSDVAAQRRKLPVSGRRWRAEVGPTWPGVRPRPVGFAIRLVSSLECLIFAEVGNRHSQRVDGNQFVGDVGPEKKDEVRGIEITV